MATMAEIEKGALRFSQAHAELGDLAIAVNKEIAEVTERYIRRIKTVAAAEKKLEQELRDLVEQSKPLFERPRTQIFHGIKVGWQKGKGKITIDDPCRTLELIRKQFPELAGSLIVTSEEPCKTEIEKLGAGDLKKIACRIEGDGDSVIVKPADGEIDKMIRALLKQEKE